MDNDNQLDRRTEAAGDVLFPKVIGKVDDRMDKIIAEQLRIEDMLKGFREMNKAQRLTLDDIIAGHLKILPLPESLQMQMQDALYRALHNFIRGHVAELHVTLEAEQRRRLEGLLFALTRR